MKHLQSGLSRRKFLQFAALTSLAACTPRRLTLPGIGAESLRIAFMTDLHLIRAPFIDDALEQIRSSVVEQRPDILLAGGDWVNNGMLMQREEARPLLLQAKSLFSSFEIPTVAIPGNHEYINLRNAKSEDPLSLFRETFGSESIRQVKSLGGYTLITLPTVQPAPPSYRGEATEEDLRWLEEVTKKLEANHPIILLLHVPLLTVLFQWKDGATTAAERNKVVTNSKRIFEILKEKNLALVLQGHLHVNEFIRWQKTTFITGGALCGQWWNGANLGTNRGFGVVTLRQKEIEWNYQDFRPLKGLA